jgi:ABC-2 type transport system permease protein
VPFLAAKTIAFAVAGLVLSVLISIAVGIAGYAILSARDLPTPELGELLERFARNAGVAALGGAFGVGIGAILRNQVVAIVGVLVIAFAVEPALVALAPEVGRFGPFGSLPTAAQGVDPQDVGMPEDVDLPAAGAAVLLLLAWIGAAFASGAALLRYRDLE